MIMYTTLTSSPLDFPSVIVLVKCYPCLLPVKVVSSGREVQSGQNWPVFPFLADKSNVAEDTVRLFVSLLSFLSLAGTDPQLYLLFVSGAAFIKVYGEIFQK